MSIDSHTNSKVRAAESKPEIAAQNRQAKLKADIAMIRLKRNMSRCRTCRHSEGVHVERGCAMDDCTCKHYRV